ncbi:unnamed protein product [Toxocara canis]|uniref:MATH domain-containing protein n=1 Tax=Toxocara canis TaxID=6265 RepID=A0A183V4K4_TOXCA|nr:unnamed protein product [Toxocara canis]
MVKTCSKAKKGETKCFGFFVECCVNGYSESWSCEADAELRLKSQKKGAANFVRKTKHTYTSKENDWGYSCFLTWEVSHMLQFVRLSVKIVLSSRLNFLELKYLSVRVDHEVMNCSRGYVKADTVMLEAFVKANCIADVRSVRCRVEGNCSNLLFTDNEYFSAEDQFDKKMKDYMALAELQSGRGQIDKAIEANAAAWGLCKDGDCHCVNELRLQRNKLIEMKLKQRIEAIERGIILFALYCSPDEGDSPLSRTTLKQAISRGAKKNSKPPSPKSRSATFHMSRNSVSDSKPVEAKSIVSSMNGAKRIAIGQDKCTKTKCPDSAEQRPKELAVEARLSEFSQNKASLEGVKASSTAVDSESVMRAKKEVVDSQMDILSTGNHESKRSRNASASVGSHQADATTMGCLRTDEWGEVLSGQKGDGESVLERIISCDDDPKRDHHACFTLLASPNSISCGRHTLSQAFLRSSESKGENTKKLDEEVKWDDGSIQPNVVVSQPCPQTEASSPHP